MVIGTLELFILFGNTRFNLITFYNLLITIKQLKLFIVQNLYK